MRIDLEIKDGVIEQESAQKSIQRHSRPPKNVLEHGYDVATTSYQRMIFSHFGFQLLERRDYCGDLE